MVSVPGLNLLPAVWLAGIILSAIVATASGASTLPTLADSAMSGFGVQFGEPVSDECWKRMKEMGVGFIRVDLPWEAVEQTKGTYEWVTNKADEIFAGAEAHGIRPLIILDGSNPLYDDRYRSNGRQYYGINHPDAAKRATLRAGLVNFAKAAVDHYVNTKRYGDILWEVWNEPDLFWYPGTNADQYMELLNVTAPAIRQVDPNAKILSAGTSQIDIPFLTACMDYPASAGSNILQLVDAIAIHPYHITDEPDRHVWLPETLESGHWRNGHGYYGMADLRALLRSRNQPNFPVMATEATIDISWKYEDHAFDGIEPPDARIRSIQGAYCEREYLNGLLAGIPMHIFWCWTSDNVGLVGSDGMTARPTGQGMRNMNAQLKGCQFTTRVHADGPEDYYAVFRNSKTGSHRVAAWTTKRRPFTSVQFPGVPSVAVDGHVRYYDLPEYRLIFTAHSGSYRGARHSFSYRRVSSARIIFEPGDKICYSTRLSTNTCGTGGIDVAYRDAAGDLHWMRELDPRDQNGIGSHPAEDLRPYAWDPSANNRRSAGKWYRREFAVPPQMWGRTSEYWDVAADSGIGPGQKRQAAYRDIHVNRGGRLLDVWSQGRPTLNAPDVWTQNAGVASVSLEIR